MAESVREIARKVTEIKESRWSFEDGLAEFSEKNVEGLCFTGELDKSDLFIMAPVTFLNPKSGKSKLMTPDEIHEYLDTGDVDGKEDWKIDTWLVIRFDLKREYIRFYKTSKVDLTKSPKANYEIEYARVKEFLDFQKPIGQLPQIFEIDLKDYEQRDPWLDLKEATEFQVDNREYDVDVPVDVKRSKFFHALNRRILDDQFERSAPTERVKLSDNYTTVKVKRSTLDTLEGVMLQSVHFTDVIEFDTKTELIDYLLSVLKWCGPRMNYHFSHILKINESNLWSYSTEDGTWVSPEGTTVPAEGYTKYEFRCCNVKGAPVIEAEVWEKGSVYTYRNHSGGTPIMFTREIIEDADQTE